jgi:hypothetical protein
MAAADGLLQQRAIAIIEAGLRFHQWVEPKAAVVFRRVGVRSPEASERQLSFDPKQL